MTENNLQQYVNADIPELLPFNPEAELDYKAQGLIIFGRGVEKKGDNWHPTALLEHGVGDRYKHTGSRDTNISGEEYDAVIGGGTANVWATQKYLVEYYKQNKNFPLVIFAAGRPSYYLSPNDPSEGEIMKKKLLQIMPKDLPLDQLEVYLLPENQDTRDDAQKSLETMSERGIKNVKIMTIEPHIDRSIDIVKGKIYKTKDLQGKFDSISFVDSFKILEDSSKDRKTNHYEKVLGRTRKKKAFRRTNYLEGKWIEFIRHNDY